MALVKFPASRFVLSALLPALVLTACQAPVTTALKPASSKAPLTAKEYSQMMGEVQRGLVRSSVQTLGSNAGLLASASGNLNTPAPSVPSSPASSNPGSNSGTADSLANLKTPPSSLTPGSSPTQTATSQRELLDTLLKALQELTDKFKAIVPPAEYQQQHAEMLAYLDLNLAVSRELVEEGNKSNFTGSASEALKKILDKHQLTEAAFRQQGAKVNQFLESLRLLSLRNELSSKQSGPVLAVSTWQARYQTLLGKLQTGYSSPTSLLLASSSKAKLTQFRADVDNLLAEIVAAVPPADQVEQHLKLYAWGRAVQDSSQILYGLVEKAGFPPFPNPQTFLNVDLLYAMSLWFQSLQAFTPTNPTSGGQPSGL